MIWLMRLFRWGSGHSQPIPVHETIQVHGRFVVDLQVTARYTPALEVKGRI